MVWPPQTAREVGINFLNKISFKIAKIEERKTFLQQILIFVILCLLPQVSDIENLLISFVFNKLNEI